MPSLDERLERLETQIERLSGALEQQTDARKRRRRVSIRCMMVAVLGFAGLFAWSGTLYSKSRRQARAVDTLLSENAFIHYAPRHTPLVRMLPGDPTNPPPQLVKVFGDDYFARVTNVSTRQKTKQPRDKERLLQALAELPELERLRLANLSLRGGELAFLAELPELQSLDLKQTQLDANPMPWLRDMSLRWLDVSHTQFGDAAAFNLAHCETLQELRLERTSITSVGLDYLTALPDLCYLNLRRSPVSIEEVKKFSKAMPNCLIDWEPLVFLPDGSVDTKAARRGRIQLGQRRSRDPRSTRSAGPPYDSWPQSGGYLPWNVYTGNLGSSGYRLDVF